MELFTTKRTLTHNNQKIKKKKIKKKERKSYTNMKHTKKNFGFFSAVTTVYAKRCGNKTIFISYARTHT